MIGEHQGAAAAQQEIALVTATTPEQPGAAAAERGIALVTVLIVTMVVGTLSAAIVLVVMSNSLASANHAAAQQALYAADAALEETIAELRTTDWRVLPGGSSSLRLRDGSASPRAPDGTPVALDRLRAALQAGADARFGTGPNRPVWHLYGRAPYGNLVPGLIVPPAYLLVWIADDGDEGDGDPERDSNQIVLVRSDAFGASGAHRTVEATLALQTAPGGVVDADAPPPSERREVRILSWRDVR